MATGDELTAIGLAVGVTAGVTVDAAPPGWHAASTDRATMAMMMKETLSRINISARDDIRLGLHGHAARLHAICSETDTGA